MKLLNLFVILSLVTNISLSFATDVFPEIKDEIKKITSSNTIKIRGNDYRLVVDDIVKNSLKNQLIKEDQLKEVLEKIHRSNPNNKILGYHIGLCGKKVTVEAFLGDNAE